MIGNHNIFWSDLRRWICCPAIKQTWENFALHFTDAHAELTETEVAVDELGFQSTNVLVEQIIDRLRACAAVANNQQDYDVNPRSKMATPPGFPPLGNTYPQLDAQVSPPTYPPPVSVPVIALLPHDPPPSASSAQEVSMAVLMQQMMKNMESMRTHLEVAQAAPRSNFRSGNQYRAGRGQKRGRVRGQGRISNCNQSQRRAYVGKYCWTHGNCAHTSAECETRTEGHRADATFVNRQGGSTNNCE